MDTTFEGDAAFFDLVAEQATKPDDRKELRRVADRYRTLSSCVELLPKFGQTSAQAWRFRAEECRTMADQFSNDQCRKTLERLAAAYDHLADSSDTTAFLNLMNGGTSPFNT